MRAELLLGCSPGRARTALCTVHSVFSPLDFTAEAFLRWPTSTDGACLLGYKLDLERDTAWVRLAAQPADNTAFARSTTLGGCELLLHFDADHKLLAVALAEASLHLPPVAVVPGAMQNLAIQYAQEVDLIQVVFQPLPEGPLHGYRATISEEPTDSAAPAIVVARENSGQVVALLLESVSELAHPTLLAEAA